uniref:Uncharacterized protein n=1 Tax=Setaria viridis TaxID=4556 RepID=A0A4U6VYA9_SETVI|nr:hypothetical protein SEVIR_2G207150v2 [Setaria viridis]
MAEFLRHLRSLADSSTIPLPPPNSSCPEMRPFLGYILSPSSPSIIHQIDGNRSSPKVPGTFPPLAPPQCGAPPTSLPHRQPMPQMEPSDAASVPHRLVEPFLSAPFLPTYAAPRGPLNLGMVPPSPCVGQNHDSLPVVSRACVVASGG